MKPETRSFYELAVERVLDQVTSDLDRALDLQALARVAALSPFHFHRLFRGMLGETPLELQRRLRLERAAWTLLEGDTPITSIAFAAGYETHESFSRAFRAHYDCSPSDFRQRGRADPARCAGPVRIELAARSGIHFRPDGAPAPRVFAIRGGTAMNVEIKHMPELRVATLTHVGPYNRIPEAFERLGRIAAEAGLFGPETMLIAVYHDDPEVTPAAELRSEAALVVAKNTELPGSVGERRLPAGRYACTTHLGAYERLGDSWARLMGEWLPASGERLAEGVSYEIYRNTPADVPKDQLVTELYIPLQ